MVFWRVWVIERLLGFPDERLLGFSDERLLGFSDKRLLGLELHSCRHGDRWEIFSFFFGERVFLFLWRVKRIMILGALWKYWGELTWDRTRCSGQTLNIVWKFLGQTRDQIWAGFWAGKWNILIGLSKSIRIGKETQFLTNKHKIPTVRFSSSCFP